MKKRVCIIGAGASGLTSIKCCLDEGIQPVCYERSNHIGGLWYYQEDLHEGACTYKSTIINTSKEMMAFSDFPPPDNFANYMHNTKIMDYFNLYAKEFGLLKHITFKTEILSCKKTEDFSTTGKWKVEMKNLTNGEIHEEVFDGVMIAIGHHAQPYFPQQSFQGLDKFKGIYMHSHDYRIPTNLFENKKVLVVGIGNSGGDIAVEASTLADQVYLSTRRGSWVMNRVSDGGLPLDYLYSTRFNTIMADYVPESWSDSAFEKVACGRFDHEDYCLKPKHKFTSQHPMVNDDLPNRILSGRVMIKDDISEITSNQVIYKDGSQTSVDVIIFATGYQFNFPFIDQSVIQVTNNRCSLYKNIFPPSLEHNTLAVIGLVQPLGAVNPISEMQSRWSTRVIKGLDKLPSKEGMLSDIELKKKEMDAIYYNSNRHTIQVDYVGYMDEIAEQFGVKPKMLKLFLHNPSLAYQVMFGPCTPYQYRLHGPGSKKNASKLIMTQDERVKAALRTRGRGKMTSQQQDGGGMISYLMKIIVVLLISYVIFQFIY